MAFWPCRNFSGKLSSRLLSPLSRENTKTGMGFAPPPQLPFPPPQPSLEVCRPQLSVFFHGHLPSQLSDQGLMECAPGWLAMLFRLGQFILRLHEVVSLSPGKSFLPSLRLSKQEKFQVLSKGKIQALFLLLCIIGPWQRTVKDRVPKL